MTLQGTENLTPLYPEQVHRIWRRYGHGRLTPATFRQLARDLLDEHLIAQEREAASWRAERALYQPPVDEVPWGDDHDHLRHELELLESDPGL